MMCCAGMVMAQSIDFNQYNANSNTAAQQTADGFTMWVISNASKMASKTFDGVEVTLAVDETTEAKTFRSVVWKEGVSKNNLICDGVTPRGEEPGSNNTPDITSGRVAMTVTINGLSAGHHSLLAYHNEVDGKTNLPTIGVAVNGETKVKGVQQTSRCSKITDCTKTYVEFDVGEGQPIFITYFSEPEDGKTYNSTSFFINSLEFDSNPYTAQEPTPANLDLHANADNGSMTLSWHAAEIAKSHAVVWGTDRQEIETSNNYQYQGESTSCVINGLTPMQPYYWRVDEISADGTVYKGNVWTFQPRRDAFPGAEGYGRYALGGRGGVVYHVTTLEDNGDDENPIEGSFRYGIKKVSGPRTIVFDVAGEIHLRQRLMVSDKFITVAGQTAPGNGIMFRGAPIGFADDGITRFVRMRRGHISDEDPAEFGADGMGMPGNDNAIMDHCSISWSIDEAFASRGGKGLTLQKTILGETLNKAYHPNYDDTEHGYAATIGGGEYGGNPGSYHHNLLAHNQGRNWSLSGGLMGGAYDGHHDVFNNVVYNWGNRATDGGTHELNFVNNYYKMGPATSQKYLLRHQFEGTGEGTQRAYYSGNIREDKNGNKKQDKPTTATQKSGETFTYELSGGQKLNWEPWSLEPFFESWAVIETAEAAYKNVLSDVGCNMPAIDKHDIRLVNETLTGTTTYKGNRTGKKGLIDHEDDAEGFDLDKLGITTESRAIDWDTDHDGIPDWFEALTGTNPSVANNNEDRDGDYYTDLEEYLNWIAVPNFIIDGKQSITLANYFAGYKAPTYSITSAEGVTADEVNGVLTVTPTATAPKLFTIKVKAEEEGISLEREFHFAYSAGATGIYSIRHDAAVSDKNAPCYDLSGRRIGQPSKKGLYIQNGKKYIVR